MLPERKVFRDTRTRAVGLSSCVCVGSSTPSFHEGTGAIKPNVMNFGADQYDTEVRHREPQHTKSPSTTSLQTLDACSKQAKNPE